MVELGPPISPDIDTFSHPTPPFAHSDRPISRPLSEISENSDNRRRSTTHSLKADKSGNAKTSRPSSEVREQPDSSKRLSASIPLGTITVNLVDYGTMAGKGSTGGSSIASSSSAPPPPSPTTKPVVKERPSSSVGRPTSILETEEDAERAGNVEADTKSDGVSPLLIAKRASLRPSPLSATYAEVAKPIISPLPSAASITSFDSTNTSIDGTGKPSVKTKPSWLRRASGTAALRSKSKSPAPLEEVGIPASTSLPPTLPPRKGGVTITTAGHLTEQAQAAASASQSKMQPPELPSRFSYAAAAAAGPSRSRLGEGQGRPAFSPANSQSSQRGEPVGNIRNRLAAWTAAAQSSSSFTLNRSESSQSLSLAGSPALTSSFASGSTAQRAQRALGSAGTAVQKGWAGLRSRGMGGSISGMSAIANAGRRSSLEQSSSWAGGIGRRGSRDRTQSSNADMRSVSVTDGPLFTQQAMLRPSADRPGKVFGKDLVDVGMTYGVYDAKEPKGCDEWDRRRKQSLPAVVVRTVDYLEIWGPKEEGIFRISGRSSHIARLRKEFDAGADIDLLKCDPSDLDPHSVAGLFKSYLRELPTPLLTHALAPKFENYIRTKQGDGLAGPQNGKVDHVQAQEDLPTLLSQLPSAHWFLLADIVKLLDLIPQYTAVNRMTLHALMLSLGPSLNIPGGVLSELLEQRDELFAQPPAITGTESANSIINFGDISISPPALAKNELPPIPDEEHHVDLAQPKKKSPRIPQKASVTRLFSSGTLPKKKLSNETLSSQHSIVNPSPPRVEVPIGHISPLPTFESGGKELPAEPTSLEIVEDLKEVRKSNDVDLERELDRSRRIPPLTPTPIADRYSSTSNQYPTLLPKKSSLSSRDTANSTLDTGRSESPSSASTNPAAVIRRGGQPVFFSHSGVGDRRERTVSNVGNGLKRKEDAESGGANDNDNRAVGEGADTAKNAKRLSAGPAPVNVREVVRSMELSA